MAIDISTQFENDLRCPLTDYKIDKIIKEQTG